MKLLNFFKLKRVKNEHHLYLTFLKTLREKWMCRMLFSFTLPNTNLLPSYLDLLLKFNKKKLIKQLGKT